GRCVPPAGSYFSSRLQAESASRTMPIGTSVPLMLGVRITHPSLGEVYRRASTPRRSASRGSLGFEPVARSVVASKLGCAVRHSRRLLSKQLMSPKPVVTPDLHQLELAHAREGRLEVADDVVGAVGVFFGVDPREQQASPLEGPPQV